MITFILLSIITVIVVGIALVVLSVAGTVGFIFAADLIVGIGIIWLIVKLFSKKKKKR